MKAKPAKAKRYHDWLAKKPCIIPMCGMPANIHHVTSNMFTPRRDDFRCIPLCKEHHQGTKLSAHGTPEAFNDRWSLHDQKEIADEYFKEFEESKK